MYSRCKICGKKIEHQARGRPKLYCSDYCRAVASAGYQDAYYKRNRDKILERKREDYKYDPAFRTKTLDYQRNRYDKNREYLLKQKRLNYKRKRLKEWTSLLPRRKNLLPVSALLKHSQPVQKNGL